MTGYTTQNRVGEIVTGHPALARVFEQFGIDYCCGGKQTLEEACRTKGYDPQCVIDALASATDVPLDSPSIDAVTMTLTDLADYIEHTHHRYVREELPRLKTIAEKVANVHGEKDPRLHAVHETFLALKQELTMHMIKEEGILFPMIRQLEAGTAPSSFHCGSIANPMNQMELEHEHAGSALARLHVLTDDYTAPDWACNTYRVLMHGLMRFEQDLHQHIHKENNILFPRALVLERETRVGAGG